MSVTQLDLQLSQCSSVHILRRCAIARYKYCASHDIAISSPSRSRSSLSPPPLTSILQRLRHGERVARLVLDVLRQGPAVTAARIREVMHHVRRRATKRHRALIAVDEGLLGGIDQAVHETGVAVGDVAPVEYMRKLLRDLIRISTK